MKIDINVPSLGESISEATVSRLLRKTGEQVQINEEIIELESDKVNQLLCSPQTGRLDLFVKEGDVVKINQVLGTIEVETNPPPSSQSISQEKPPSSISMPQEKPPSSISSKIIKEEPPFPNHRKPMSLLRRTVAKRLVAVKNETAMLTTFNEVDMTTIVEIRKKEQEGFQERYGVRLGFMSFFVKATALALKAFPQVHSYIDGDDLVSFSGYDIGIAVSTDKGLVVPVVKNCDTLSFGEVEKAISTFAKKAREGKLSIDELQGGSFTITNGGTFGSLLSTPILNPPQSGILGMHAILKRPIAVEEKVVIRSMMYLAFSYDHRVIDGRDSVQFLMHIKENLESPFKLLLEL